MSLGTKMAGKMRNPTFLKIMRQSNGTMIKVPRFHPAISPVRAKPSSTTTTVTAILITFLLITMHTIHTLSITDIPGSEVLFPSHLVGDGDIRDMDFITLTIHFTPFIPGEDTTADTTRIMDITAIIRST